MCCSFENICATASISRPFRHLRANQAEEKCGTNMRFANTAHIARKGADVCKIDSMQHYRTLTGKRADMINHVARLIKVTQCTRARGTAAIRVHQVSQ